MRKVQVYQSKADETLGRFALAFGAVLVLIIALSGCSALTTNGASSLAPNAATITPTSGPTGGGTQVTINGANFAPGATASFGDAAATGVSVVDSGKEVLAATPAYPTGTTVDVVITDPDGRSTTLAKAFTYNLIRTISSVSPNLGSPQGGTNVSIGGAGFEPDATVSFGGIAGTSVFVNGQGTGIGVTAPAHASGVVPIVVTNPDGTSVTAASAFTYGSLQVGCGTDCGNVGDPYEGATFSPAGKTAIQGGACPGKLTAGTSYYLMGNVGSSLSLPGCITVARGDTLDIRGFTVTGQILGFGDTSGITLFNGIVKCNIPDTPTVVGGCILVSGDRTLSARTRFHHLTVDNVGNSGTNEVRSVEADSPVTLVPGLGYKIDHLTIAVESAPTSSRAIGINVISGDDAEINNNSLTCSTNANACQGMQVIDSTSGFVPALIHNNLLLMLSAPSLPETARGIEINGPDNGAFGPSGFQVYSNECTANVNRCFRARQVTGATFQNNLVHACANTADGCYHFADPSGTGPFVGNSGILVENDTVEMDGGTAYFIRNGAGITIENDTLVGTSGKLGRVDFLSSNAVSTTAAFCSVAGASGLTIPSTVSSGAAVEILNAGTWNTTGTPAGLIDALSTCP